MSTENIIKASPTKEFFIDMLTRDIPLSRALIDLIDNSIDGAKSIRPNEDFNNLIVKIDMSKDQFIITDNCGGFSLKTAKEYAFRFGRPKEAKFVDHSIGRFGVGMKRALFKIGKSFIVESKHKRDHFLVQVDVDKWLSKPDEWDFTYKSIEPKKGKLNDSDGTIITVTKLHKNVSTDFMDSVFLNELEKEVSLALNFSLLKGLKLYLNGKDIVRKDVSFLWSKSLKPFFKQISISTESVVVKIYCGIGEPMPSVAGWYIFCNDRLVLEADKSYTTGWKEEREDESSSIKYHNKFAMFRGVVLFDSKDSSKLPMTTTKTGIDSDHPVYKAIRPEMLAGMKQVLLFLNKINDRETRDDIVNNAQKKNIDQISKETSNLQAKFIAPTIKLARQTNGLVTITYAKDKILVEKVKSFFNTSSSRDVGEKTFDYFVNLNKKEL